MTNTQKERFKKHLETWKISIENEIKSELEIELNNELSNLEYSDEGDFIDKKNIIDFQEKRKSHHTKLVNEINYALRKIQENTFGICEETGEEIELKRLEANPIARYSLEAQKIRENY